MDRDGTLKKAESFVRMGRTDAAIAEYLRVLEDTPDDWKTATVLADLFVKAGRVDQATPLLAGIADNLARQGFLPRAQAFYKRILKVSPADEYALTRLADIATTQGILVEAKAHLLALARAQQARGDRRAATETLLRLGALDAGDVSTRIEAARAAADGGDADLAAVELGRVVTDLTSDERRTEALDVLRQAVAIVPSDAALRQRLVRAGRRTIEEKHSFRIRMDKIALLYDQLTKRSPGRP